jgi:hypothetical protein
MTFLRLLVCIFTWVAVSVLSETREASANTGKPTRQKVIDFEDEVVEGMNKRPLDSLSQISDRDRRRKKLHLYRKRVGFRAETSETLRELRYVE